VPISMDTFTWQVVATFAAAGGAVIVGWRQVGIAKSQSDTAAAALRVAETQAATSRLAQRTTLFEKRFAVYQAVQAYISLRLAESGLKVKQGDHEFQRDARKIWVARHQALFLFSDETRKRIDNACDMADKFVMIRGQQTLFPTPESEKKRAENTQKARLELIGVLKNLSERMGEEMNLRLA
jgi:hypothetical protein